MLEDLVSFCRQNRELRLVSPVCVCQCHGRIWKVMALIKSLTCICISEAGKLGKWFFASLINDMS